MVYEGPEFRHLAAFVAVAEECSFGRAADRLSISQPSLSKQIRLIEDGLRSNLLIRSQSGASLTASGRKFLVFARQMIHMRDHAVRVTTSDQPGTELPLRFGYSPFADHRLVDEARAGYVELVLGGLIQTSSDCSAELTRMVADGRLDAALVSLPLTEKDLFVHPICKESLLVCLRRDDPLADGPTLPQNVIGNRLSIMFARVHQPKLYDSLMRKFARLGIELHPSEFVSSPNEMQYLVKSGADFGLVQESTSLDPELMMMSIAGIDLSVKTAFICHSGQMRPVLPMLAYRIERRCSGALEVVGQRRPNGRVIDGDWAEIKKASCNRLRTQPPYSLWLWGHTK